MTHLESREVKLAQSPEKTFQFLSQFENIGKLMPTQVENFRVSDQTCRFTIKGMASLGLEYKRLNPDSEIVMSKTGEGPFDFDLLCHIRPDERGESLLKLSMQADLNPFLKMMAEKPLTAFLNLLVDKYSQLVNEPA